MIIIVTTIACFTCGAIGYFVGWITTADRLDRRAEAPREPVSVVTARESDEFWEGVYAGSHARVSPRVTAGGGFPALPAVPVLERRLVAAGDVIPSWGDRPLNATEAAAVNARAQPPLGELVQPGRTTDFISKVRADTDRWLADRGLLEVTSAPE